MAGIVDRLANEVNESTSTLDDVFRLETLDG